VVVVDTKDHVVVAGEVNKVDNFAKDGSVWMATITIIISIIQIIVFAQINSSSE
jgi:hypothetical protein